MKALSFATTSITFLVLSIPLHEFFHYIVLLALGGRGTISFFDNLASMGHLSIIQPPAYGLWLVTLSGGVGVAAFFLLLLYLPARLSATLHDLHYETAALTIALVHLSYAFTELVSPSHTILANLLPSLGAALALLLIVPRLLKWSSERR